MSQTSGRISPATSLAETFCLKSFPPMWRMMAAGWLALSTGSSDILVIEIIFTARAMLALQALY